MINALLVILGAHGVRRRGTPRVLLHRNVQKFGTITNTLGQACELAGTIRTVPTQPRSA